MWAGVTIVNSEVGRSSIWIKPMVIYGNSEDEHQYSFMDRSLEGCESIRHTSELTIERVRDAITRARDVAQVGIYRLLEAEKELVNPISAVKELVEDCDFLTNRLVEVIEEEYKDVAFVSKLKLAQSMLEAIKELPLFKRYLAECEIGRYLDLFADTDERLNSIVQAAQLVEQHEVAE
jgi:hypothetical protein